MKAARLGLVAAVAVGGMLAAARCYTLPEPDCGFICGQASACPADYTCASDDHCHRNRAPADLVCVFDAGPGDARPDAP